MKSHNYRINKISRIIKTGIMLSALVLGLIGYLQLEEYGYGLDRISTFFDKSTPDLYDRFSNYKQDSITFKNIDLNVLGASTENAKSVPVLIYHGIVEEVKGGGDVLYEDFKQQMISLKENGYETITLTELYDFLNNGKTVPKKSFVITFDDGRKDSFYPVDPVLKALDYNAVMFLISGSIKDKDVYHLTRSEINEMLNTNRWEIGSHSNMGHVDIQIDEQGNKGHWLSNKLWLADKNRVETEEEYSARVSSDLISSKDILENEFSKSVISYAFPFGDYGQNTKNYLDAHKIFLEKVEPLYKLAFYQSWSELGNRNYPLHDHFLVRRITVDSSTKKEDLLLGLESGEDKEIGYSDTFNSTSNWISNWGSIEPSDDLMILKSDNSESGGSTYLKGSELWDEYKIEIDVKPLYSTDTFSILFRVDRDGNYSYCNYSKNGVSYNEKFEGEVRNGKYWNHSLFSTFSAGFRGGVINDGNTVSCLVNDKVVVKDDIRTDSGYGMIGFSVWSQENVAFVKLDNFSSSVLELVNE